jgi:diguanylate cyclase (GGDEF)-like protein
VIEAFTQTALNEFDWWACQIWFETDGQLVPEKWIFGPSVPRSLFNLEKIFTSPIPSPTNEETLSLPYSSNVSPVLDSARVLWAKQNTQLEELGLRTFLDVNVAGASTTSIRLLFVLPSSRVLPTRLRLTFENVIAQLPQLVRRARSVEELNYRATHDELTGLLNRRGLDVEFARIPSHEGIKRSKTIFFLDLDRFKSVNDLYGHQIGDELLVEISHRLMKSSRPVDAISRIGGDEFVIVAQGFDQSDDIATTSNRFLHNLSEQFVASDGTKISPRVSIGISTWDSTEELARAVTEADKNMYEAKSRGGNQAVSDGWTSTDSSGLESGENYAISYQSINNKDGSQLVGAFARIKLPAFFAPQMISEISGQIYQNVSKRNISSSSQFILLLEIAATSRSDRANTMSLVDSITELANKKFRVVTVVNLDSRTLDGTPIAREIVGHGNATIALGNLFDKPFEIQLIQELKPSFLIRSATSINWDVSKEPVLADRAALSLSAELGIPVILPTKYAQQYADYLEKFANIFYLNNEEES